MNLSLNRNQVRFSCTALKGNKKGILPKDSDGYYVHIVGALASFNSVQEFYTYDGARQLFEQSSSFMRRVKAGCLKGELGHPKPLPGQSMESYANRIMTIEETNVCVHFADIWLDFESVKDANGRPVIAIMAKLTPSGPMGHVLQKSLDNPREETCFSIRAFTEDAWIGGVKHRTLKQIISFDFVGESGISYARKYQSPSLESLQDNIFNRDDLVKILVPDDTFIATESAKSNVSELFLALHWDLNGSDRPSFTSW